MPELVVKVALHRVLRLSERLQENCCCGDILARVELLRELHAGIIDNVAVNPTRPTAGGPSRVSPLGS